METRKVLYSVGYGAGWSTWNMEIGKFMAEYQPIIDFIESGNKFDEDRYGFDTEVHSLIQQLKAEAKEKFDVSYVCTLGANDLRVATVNGPYRVTEYDGFESIETADSIDWW